MMAAIALLSGRLTAGASSINRIAKATSGLFWQLADGTGSAERLTKAERATLHIPESWSPDGEHLLFRVNKGTLPDSGGPSSLMDRCRSRTRK